METTTALCRRLGIAHPVWNAPMGAGTAGPALAAAVSNAGGLGLLGVFGVPPSRIGAMVEATRALTDRPFGAGIVLHGERVERQVEACLDARPSLLLFFWGDPSPWVSDARARGILVAAQVGSLEEAVAAAEAGVDVVVAQGVEAGGHVRGRTPRAALVAAAVHAVRPIPVVAAGGIADGLGLAESLLLGAAGILLGTRFLATAEAEADERYKQAIVAARASDTRITELFDVGWPGAPHRVIRNRIVREWEDAGEPPAGSRPREGTIVARAVIAGRELEVPRYAISHPMPGYAGDLEEACLYAGESCERIDAVEPAAHVVERLVEDARAILARA